MPYISEIAFMFLNLSRKILPPQHIVGNPFSDYPDAKKDNVHKPGIAFKPNYADFQAAGNTKIETYSIQEYIFQP